jgi:hypothetical protein
MVVTRNTRRRRSVRQSIARNVGRPMKSFESCSERTKQRRSNELIAGIGFEAIEHAYLLGLHKTQRKHVADILSFILVASPGQVREILDSLGKQGEDPLSADEALALSLDLDLSKNDYENLRRYALNHNSKLIPPYHHLAYAKTASRPSASGMVITDSRASISLQCLMDHTVKRIIKGMAEEEIANCNENIELLSKWGCDGASGQSEYKQIQPDGFSDRYMFMVSMVPITIRSIEPTTSTFSTVWKNPRPCSTRYCRPIMFEYAKETSEKIKEEVTLMENQIKILQPTIVTAFGRDIKVVHRFFLTMVDGKVCQALTDTSSTVTCNVCGANPTDMNNLECVVNRPERKEVFRLGLSTLHCWIRFMECVLHIAYNLEFKKWIAKTSLEKATKLQTINRIREQFRQKTGLIIDVAKQGSGNSNDGNTARRFFEDPDLTAKITKIDVNLIRKFSVILKTLVSGCFIDDEKFKNYTLGTAELYVQLYPWYKMPASVHKVLIHGSSIIRSSVLPIGDLSEEAQEAKNKDYKNFRLFHTRKTSRSSTNTDLFNLLLSSSCPYLATLRYTPKSKKTNLCPEILPLLREE